MVLYLQSPQQCFWTELNYIFDHVEDKITARLNTNSRLDDWTPPSIGCLVSLQRRSSRLVAFIGREVSVYVEQGMRNITNVTVEGKTLQDLDINDIVNVTSYAIMAVGKSFLDPSS